MGKPELDKSTTVRVCLVKPLAAGQFIPGVPTDGSVADLDSVYAKGYLDAGLIKEVAKVEAPLVATVASTEKEGV
jgi:hypothetical protein